MASEDIYLTDEQIAHRLNMGLSEWMAAATVLERVGLPTRSSLFNGRRHWPAIKDFLYARERRSTRTVPAEKESINGFARPTRAMPKKEAHQERANLVVLADHKTSSGVGLSPDNAQNPR